MIRPIVTDIKELRLQNELVYEGDDITQIIQDLKDTLAITEGVGLAANQIGYHKRIALIDTKFPGWKPLIIINPEIIDKYNKTIIPNESCLSFPGMKVTTDRYLHILAEYTTEDGERVQTIYEGVMAVIFAHECQHCRSGIFLDSRHKGK